jgi:hypothetical protein
MSDEKPNVGAGQAIEMAMNQVRAKGLSEEHMNALFKGSQDISAREALMIAHIQHLEAKVFALGSIMEEIAVMKGGAAVVAQSALENLVSTPRKTNGDN